MRLAFNIHRIYPDELSVLRVWSNVIKAINVRKGLLDIGILQEVDEELKPKTNMSCFYNKDRQCIHFNSLSMTKKECSFCSHKHDKTISEKIVNIQPSAMILIDENKYSDKELDEIAETWNNFNGILMYSTKEQNLAFLLRNLNSVAEEDQFLCMDGFLKQKLIDVTSLKDKEVRLL